MDTALKSEAYRKCLHRDFHSLCDLSKHFPDDLMGDSLVSFFGLLQLDWQCTSRERQESGRGEMGEDMQEIGNGNRLGLEPAPRTLPRGIRGRLLTRWATPVPGPVASFCSNHNVQFISNLSSSLKSELKISRGMRCPLVSQSHQPFIPHWKCDENASAGGASLGNELCHGGYVHLLHTDSVQDCFYSCSLILT